VNRRAHSALADRRIVISTNPEHRSTRLARNLVERRRLRCGGPSCTSSPARRSSLRP